MIQQQSCVCPITPLGMRNINILWEWQSGTEKKSTGGEKIKQRKRKVERLRMVSRFTYLLKLWNDVTLFV